jgi:hypothetical protein
MTWTKLDDGIFDHPKMVRAGEDAANLYVRGLVYCNRYLTDGRLDPEVLSVLTRKRDAAKLAEALVRVGAWEPCEGGGWLVHNFHEHNPTAEEVEARRLEVSRKRSEAGKRGGLRSGEARSNEAKLKQTTKQNEASDNEATKQNRSPDPSRPGHGSDDDDDKAAGAAIVSSKSEAAPDPRRERSALEVLAQASRGVVSMLASAPDMVAFNDLVTSAALDIDELMAFGEALALRDGAKRIWPSSKARALGQTIPAGWLLGRGGRGRTLLEGIQRWREIKAAETAQPALLGDQTPARTSQPVASFPAPPATARVVASNVDEIKHLFRRKGALA